MKQIWPSVYQFINGAFYFILSVIKGIVSYAIKQIKGDYE